MAFGRLDVFFPDGMYKTFLLTDSNTSVGRSPGNTIALETETISRYHLTFTFKDGEVWLKDLESANGTFVDGTRIKHDEPLRLRGGEEINIGELILIYHDPDANPTRPVPVLEETQHVESVGAQFTVDLEAPEIAVSPGAYAPARVSITNLSDENQKFLVSVVGVPRDWVRIDRPQVEVSAGKTADITISFKPLRRSDSAPGLYTPEVVVQPRDDAASAVKLSAPLKILPYGGFGLAMEGRRLRQGESFRLHVHNQGSGPLNVKLSAKPHDGADVDVRFSTPTVSLAPGQRQVISGIPRPLRVPLFGEPQTSSFTIVAQSLEQPKFTIMQRGYLTVKPALPRWTAFALGGALLAGISLLILALVVIFSPSNAPPEILSLSVREARVLQGDPITVDWEVSNAETVDILFQNIPVLEDADPQTGTANISSSNLVSGTYQIILRAERGELAAEALTSVEVYVPLNVSYFTLSPTPIVRYVAKTLTLTWNVTGAVTTQIAGLENLTTSPIDTTYGPIGNVNFVAVPSAPSYTLLLTAQDASGQTIAETITFDAIDPQCTAVNDLNLYDAPRDGAQVISTVPASTNVVVNAQDPTGAWLRVIGRGWGRRAEFLCAVTFNPSDLQIELNIPTPPPATPTPTITVPPPTATVPTSAPATTPPRTPSTVPPTPAAQSTSGSPINAQAAPTASPSLPPVIVATATMTPTIQLPPSTPSG